jgi:hypothetical protein
VREKQHRDDAIPGLSVAIPIGLLIWAGVAVVVVILVSA